MSQVENLWGGFQSDESKELQGGSYDGIVFGLNDKVKIVNFGYTTKTGAGGAEGNPALEIELEINGGTKSTRIYTPGGNGYVYFKGKQVTDQKSPEYMQGLRSAIILAKGLITHYLKAVGYTDEQLNKNLSTVKSFQELCEKASKAMTKHLNTTPIHLFGQYQNSIKGSATQTYVEIPDNLAYGPFLCPAIEPKDGSWEAVTENGLKYVDGAGNVHPFQRDKNYMEGNRANKQTKDGANSAAAAAFSLPTTELAPASGTAVSTEEDEDWD